MKTKSELNKVGQTAWMTAYLRSFSDIPFCPEIFAELERMQTEFGEKMPVMDMGFTAYFKDTEGNVVGLWENK